MPRKHGTYIILWYYSYTFRILSVTYSTQRFSPWAITTTEKSGPITQVTRAQGHASSRPRSCTGSTCVVCPCVYDYNIIVVTMRIIENAFCAHLLCNDGTALAACWQINWVDVCVTFPNTRHTLYYNTTTRLIAILYVYNIQGDVFWAPRLFGWFSVVCRKTTIFKIIISQ